MTSRKRKPLTGAGRGVGAFFDEEAPANRVDRTTQASQHTDIQASAASDEEALDELERATFYIRPEQQEALEELKIKLRRRNVKTNKSALIRQAIDLLGEQDLDALHGRLASR